MADISILMLGGSGSGKTCLILGMYADMRIGRQGITLTAPANDDLEMTERWRILKKGIAGKERFPAPNNDAVAVDIAMLYGFREFMTFSWFDYPGRALQSQEAATLGIDLEAKVRQANTIFVCMPGDDLLTYVRTGDNNLETLNVGELNRLFGTIRDRNADEEDRPAVVVVVTKYDIFKDVVDTDLASLSEGLETLGIEAASCPDVEKKPRYILEEAVKSLMHPLFAEEYGFDVLISPATLGFALARQPETGAIEPKWLLHPLAFSYVEYAQTLFAQWKRALRTESERLQELKGRFLQIFVRSEIADSHKALDDAAKRIGEIEKRLHLIQKLLPAWAIIYRKGMRISGPDYAG